MGRSGAKLARSFRPCFYIFVIDDLPIDEQVPFACELVIHMFSIVLDVLEYRSPFGVQ